MKHLCHLAPIAGAVIGAIAGVAYATCHMSAAPVAIECLFIATICYIGAVFGYAIREVCAA